MIRFAVLALFFVLFESAPRASLAGDVNPVPSDPAGPTHHFGLGVSNPNDGALARRWLTGPAILVGRRLWHSSPKELRWYGSYDFHAFGDEGSYATHGVRSTLGWIVKPECQTGIEVGLEFGVGGYWTTKFEGSGIELVADQGGAGPLPRIGMIRGWGPVFGISASLLATGTQNDAIGIRVARYRTWASDTHLDTTMIGLHVGIP